MHFSPHIVSYWTGDAMNIAHGRLSLSLYLSLWPTSGFMPIYVPLTWPSPPASLLQRWSLSVYSYKYTTQPLSNTTHSSLLLLLHLLLLFLSVGVMGKAVEEVYDTNVFDSHQAKVGAVDECKWFEEEIDDDLKLSYALNSVLHSGASKYQDIALLDTKHFGKALVIDGNMQSTEMDEFIYHECLIHPALLFHPK